MTELREKQLIKIYLSPNLFFILEFLTLYDYFLFSSTHILLSTKNAHLKGAYVKAWIVGTKTSSWKNIFHFSNNVKIFVKVTSKCHLWIVCFLCMAFFFLIIINFILIFFYLSVYFYICAIKWVNLILNSN